MVLQHRVILFALASLCSVLLATGRSAAQTPPCEYERLTTEVGETGPLIEELGEAASQGQLDEAVENFSELIQCIDTFERDPWFRELEPWQQRSFLNTRNWTQYYRASALMLLDRCDEAEVSLRSLLAVVWGDELPVRVVISHDQAAACALPSTSVLDITYLPTSADAQVFVDGERLGPAAHTHTIEGGSHQLELRADGYLPKVITIEAIPGQPVILEILLEPEPEPEAARKSPLWYEWTLWGAGVAGIAAGIGFFVSARNLEDALQSIPLERVVDPRGVQDVIDRRYRTAYALGSIGIASAIVGTVLYATRDAEEPPPRVSWGGGIGPENIVSVSVRF